MTTKTLNPLHFEDLEPHRFEDLVRQLLYDFKNWKSLEATGRLGADEGIDIRGTEDSSLIENNHDDEYDNDDNLIKDSAPVEKLWIIQCKREKEIGPTKIKHIISKALSSLAHPPFGFMLIASCDFSKKTRDTFRIQMIEQGVQDYLLLGKAEIEDLLFMPKNDHLLFAYFGISIQIRRRTIKTKVRSRLMLKRKLVKELGDFLSLGHQAILIRDPKNEEYPYIKNEKEFIKEQPWRYFILDSHNPPDYLAFIVKRHFAYADLGSKEWDVIPDCDTAVPYQAIYNLSRNAFDPENKQEICRIYWERNTPVQNRAWAMTLRFIHYDRILALDELGDSCNEGPHLLVDYINGNDPFEPNWFSQTISLTENRTTYNLKPVKKLRKSFFLKKIPDERDIYYKELDERINKKPNNKTQ